MSGGSYDYVYGRVSDAADGIRSRHDDSPLHMAFADHLELVAKALHDIEWVDSCDYGEGADIPAIKAVVNPDAVAGASIERFKEMMKQLEAAAALVKGWTDGRD